MSDEVKVILDLSPAVQELLYRQEVDLYQELRRSFPSIRVTKGPDPQARPGSKDVAVDIILATATLISSLTPVIIRILDQITPPNRFTTWVIEETETRDTDGKTVMQRKYVRSSNERHILSGPPDSPKASETSNENSSGPREKAEK
ncbi:MAG TPA: hypothetical protein VKY19_05275 [Ktedonosporobacter sp.]|nr:hypothetical protein [Ktedonosporobacter sp.]